MLGKCYVFVTRRGLPVVAIGRKFFCKLYLLADLAEAISLDLDLAAVFL